eukprot:scaffold1813_cov129-Isochrysis_galbana.AAC.7
MAENGGKRQSRNSGDKKSRRRGDGVEKKAYVPGSRGRPPKWFNELAATEAAAIISAAAAAVSATQATSFQRGFPHNGPFQLRGIGGSRGQASRAGTASVSAGQATISRSPGPGPRMKTLIPSPWLPAASRPGRLFRPTTTRSC